jgi:hypothetical protein
MLKKKFGSIFKELYNILPKKLSLSSQKYGLGIQDPRSRIRDPGSEKTYPDPGSWIRIRNTDFFITEGKPLSKILVRTGFKIHPGYGMTLMMECQCQTDIVD